MTKEEIIRAKIVSDYGSVLKFSESTGIPYSTIRNCFSRGFESLSAGIAVEICKQINIDLESIMDGALSVRPNEQKKEAWKEFSAQRFTDDEKRLIGLYRQMNTDGQEKLLETADDMVQSQKYVSASAVIQKGDGEKMA